MTGRRKKHGLHRGKDGVLRARPVVAHRRRPDGSTDYVRKRMSFPEARTEREARLMIDEELRRYGAGGPGVGPCVPEMLYRYIDVARTGGLSPASARTYRSLVANQVEPFWAGMEAAEVEAYMVDDLYAELLAHGLRDGSGCSTATVAKLHGLLAPAFAWMEERGVVARDPMARVKRPRERRGEAFFFDDEHLDVLLPALGELMGNPSGRQRLAYDRVMATASYLSLRCGLREGEVLALVPRQLKRASMDLWVNGTVSVRGPGEGTWRQPVTKGSRSRRVPVEADVVEVLDELAAWREGLPGRPAPGLLCVAAGPYAGRWLRPSTLSRWFKRLCARLGLPEESVYHSTRHTCASIWLDHGADFRQLQKWFGHADAATTVGMYGHTSPARDRRASAAMARYLEDKIGPRGPAKGER